MKQPTIKGELIVTIFDDGNVTLNWSGKSTLSDILMVKQTLEQQWFAELMKHLEKAGAFDEER